MEEEIAEQFDPSGNLQKASTVGSRDETPAPDAV